ncbi:MAG: tetratricopeptide repeat protein [Desulfuromonadales bacterium]|nr:tetratricopeptide repeat protein [Desulfuromonadales bacterium]
MPKSLLHALILLISICCIPASGWCDSEPLGNPAEARKLIERGEYEKGLEQLQRTQQLYPLDQSIKRSLAEGYQAYGMQLLQKKQFEQADAIFARGRELYPEEPRFMLLRGICTYHLKKYDIARYELEQARQLQPDNVDLLHVLGRVLYDTDNRSQAVELWQQALKLSPDNSEIKVVLERARREMAVEELMARGHSSRFDLTYDNGVDTVFALAVLDQLENAANQVGAELGHFPTARVPVSIYTRADYSAVTAAPDWSGGVYDGTIRLPFGALREVTPPLQAVLYHEYAHVVVRELTHGNCPLWLNEGIAEMFGRQQFSPPLTELDRAARSQGLGDFKKLEGGFSGLGTKDAGLAYQQSYALVNYLVTTYGWHRVNAILTALGAGLGIEEAIAKALGEYSLTYEGLVKEWRESLERGRK